MSNHQSYTEVDLYKAIVARDFAKILQLVRLSHIDVNLVSDNHDHFHECCVCGHQTGQANGPPGADAPTSGSNAEGSMGEKLPAPSWD